LANIEIYFSNPYGIAVDTAKAVDTAVVLQFYFMSTAKMQ
jgi:hypothetical protein